MNKSKPTKKTKTQSNSKKSSKPKNKRTITLTDTTVTDGVKTQTKYTKSIDLTQNLNDTKANIVNADVLPKNIDEGKSYNETNTNQPKAFVNAMPVQDDDKRDQTIKYKQVDNVSNSTIASKNNNISTGTDTNAQVFDNNREYESLNTVTKTNVVPIASYKTIKHGQKFRLTKKAKQKADKNIVKQEKGYLTAFENKPSEKYKNTKRSLKNKNKKFFESKMQNSSTHFIKKDNTNRLLTSIVSVCVVIMVLIVARFYVENTGNYDFNQFENGALINGVNVSGLETNQAAEKLTRVFADKGQSFELMVKHGDQSWHFDKEDFTVSSDIHVIIEEALKRDQINRSYESQKNRVLDLQNQGKSYDVAFNYIYVGLDEKIDEVIKSVEYDPVNSEIKFNAQNKNPFEITEDKKGIKVNKDLLYSQINHSFMQDSKVEVELPLIEVEAEHTVESNKLLTTKIAEYSTNVSDSTGSRKHNVKLALDKINGLVVQPGQSVSFNQLTGPHSLSAGYQVATIIYQGRFVDGVGGGVCQASTTLYNALLLADLQVDNVYKHTLPVKYVPLALDAMVSEGVADLKFTNNHNYPVYIKTSYNSESVKVEIFGHFLEHGMQIKTRSEVIKELKHKGDIIRQDIKQEHINKVLYKGEQFRLSYPRNGYEAKSYQEYYKDGKLVETKLVRHEIYHPQQGVIIEGAMEKPAGFDSITEKPERIYEDDTETIDAFMFNQENGHELLKTVDTRYCP